MFFTRSYSVGFAGIPRLKDRTPMFPKIDGLAEINASYDIILSDVWGVLHNGVQAHPAAATALTRFRGAGGIVVLITNSPKPRSVVIRQLKEFGVDESAYDSIVTSGDVTRDLIRLAENPIYHLGPARPGAERPRLQSLKEILKH